jgi:hypothetical protein
MVGPLCNSKQHRIFAVSQCEVYVGFVDRKCTLFFIHHYCVPYLYSYDTSLIFA